MAFGKQGHFAKPLQKGTRIKLVVQAQSQPDNIATLPLLTATFVRPAVPLHGEVTLDPEDGLTRSAETDGVIGFPLPVERAHRLLAQLLVWR